MKRLCLLGASGSIGTQTLDVIHQHPDRFSLVSFSVGHNIAAARQILAQFPVPVFCVAEEKDAEVLRQEYPACEILSGDAGLSALASRTDYDVLVNALVGFVGFLPTLRGIESGHDVALANKETLVVGGELIDRALDQYGRKLLPIDSEHSAIFQCLQGNQLKQVRRLIITASGGAFRTRSRAELKEVTVEQALAHPNWKMGAKITVDSATMMNKGFEVMEAHWLFGMPYDQIDVLMHQESVVHSIVEYVDHSFLAQMGCPDMRLPIQYALTWPERLPLQEDETFDLARIGTLHFAAPDLQRYPLLKTAYEAGRAGGILPAVVNGANEVANASFRAGKSSFLMIEETIQAAVQAADRHAVQDPEDLIKADAWARDFAVSYLRMHAD